MTVEEFESFLGDYAERLQDIGADLTPLVNDIVNELKNDAPYKEGDLKRSIVGAVRGETVEFGWLDYGTYQNFGVSGKDGTRISSGRQRPFGITNPIELGPFGYKPQNRRWGLSAKPWFDVPGLAQEISDEIRRLTENNNNEE